MVFNTNTNLEMIAKDCWILLLANGNFWAMVWVSIDRSSATRAMASTTSHVCGQEFLDKFVEAN
jgi:hypothetical protein